MKPQYTLHIHNTSCSFIGMINDIPAFINMMGLPFNINVPINHFLKNGTNTITVLIKPTPSAPCLDKFTKCHAKIMLKNQGEPISNFSVIAESSYRSGTADANKGIQLASVEGTFKANLPFEDHMWTHAPTIILNEKTIKLVSQKMQTLFQLFSLKNLNSILELAVLREKEISESFYSDFTIGQQISSKVYESTFNDPNWILQPLNLEEYAPMLYGHNKLVACLNTNYDSAIHYINEKENLRRDFPFYFFIDINNEFKIIL